MFFVAACSEAVSRDPILFSHRLSCLFLTFVTPFFKCWFNFFYEELGERPCSATSAEARSRVLFVQRSTGLTCIARHAAGPLTSICCTTEEGKKKKRTIISWIVGHSVTQDGCATQYIYICVQCNPHAADVDGNAGTNCGRICCVKVALVGDPLDMYMPCTQPFLPWKSARIFSR